jgi:c-di-GMP-binding flagellar brake protein YcgR
MFSSVIQFVHYEANTAMLTMSWPAQIQQLQRRAYQRVRPPEDVVIAVRFWRQEGAAGVPVEGRTVRYGQLEDISAGGLRIKVADPGDIEVGMAFRCVFEPHPGKSPLILDTLVRHREAADCGRASIGLQAVGLEATAEGRRTLERLARTVSRFQRLQSRRRR